MLLLRVGCLFCHFVKLWQIFQVIRILQRAEKVVHKFSNYWNVAQETLGHISQR